MFPEGDRHSERTLSCVSQEDDMKTSARQAAMMVGRGAGALAVLGMGYLARNWYQYGKVTRDGRPNPLLDMFMPTYEVREYHEARVAAPVEIAYQAVRAMDMNRSRLVRGIFRAREIALRADAAEKAPSLPFLEQAQALGWRLLAEEAEREIVFGAVTQPWVPNVRFESVPPEEFARFDAPAYVKIAFTTDTYARERFRRYWAVVSPGVRVIRLEMLRVIRADAERRYRLSRVQPLAQRS
jgi:hypothetical protein